MRIAEGPMSTPRRPAPRSMGTPITPMLRRFLAMAGQTSTRRKPAATPAVDTRGNGELAPLDASGRECHGPRWNDLTHDQDGLARERGADPRGGRRRVRAIRAPAHAAPLPQAAPGRALRRRLL